MLILMRRPDERIILDLPDGREIEVVVTSINGKQASIGVSCDRDINIRRSEIPQNKDSEETNE